MNSEGKPRPCECEGRRGRFATSKLLVIKANPTQKWTYVLLRRDTLAEGKFAEYLGMWLKMGRYSRIHPVLHVSWVRSATTKSSDLNRVS
jgi:hypothetical protein